MLKKQRGNSVEGGTEDRPGTARDGDTNNKGFGVRKRLKHELVACKEEISLLKKSAPSPKREEVAKSLMERWALDRSDG